MGAEVWTSAFMLPAEGLGGEGQSQAQVDRQSGWIPVMGDYYSQASRAMASADASTGDLRVLSMGSVVLWPLCDPCSASTPFAIAKARFWDSWTVGDEPMQLDVNVNLTGALALHGTPSGGSDWWYRVNFGTYPGAGPDDLFAVDIYSGGLLPTLAGDIGPLRWTQRVTLEAGETYYAWGEVHAQVGDSGFYGYGLGLYENWIDTSNTASFRLHYAPGYEGREIVSAAGGRVLPPLAVPPVPEPGTALLLALGLIGLAVAPRGRRRASEGCCVK